MEGQVEKSNVEAQSLNSPHPIPLFSGKRGRVRGLKFF